MENLKEKLIQNVIDKMFTNGSGQVATRLVLWDDKRRDNPKLADLGGYSKPAIHAYLEEFYEAVRGATQ